MKYSDHITAFAPPESGRRGVNMIDVERQNVERVRGYLQENLGCMQVEVCRALDLNPRTVSKAIKIIRGKL